MSKSMIHVVCGAMVALVPAHAWADEAVASLAPVEYEEPDHVLLPAHAEARRYGTPKVKATTTGPATLAGGPGRWFFDHGFVITATGYALATTYDAPIAMSPATSVSTLQGGYGGPRFSYLYRPHDVVHFNVGFVVGAGGYSVVSRNYANGYESGHDDHHFFALEPQAELEANMMRDARVAFGLSHRFIGMSPAPGIEANDLGGTAASILIKIGTF